MGEGAGEREKEGRGRLPKKSPHLFIRPADRGQSLAAALGGVLSPFLRQPSQIPFRSRLDPMTVKFAAAETLEISSPMMGSDQSMRLPH